MADNATTTTTTTETPKTTTEQPKTTEAAKTNEGKLPPGFRPGFDIPPQRDVGMENDPNFKMREMLARRGKKKEGEVEAKPAETPGKPAETGAKEAEKTETKTSPTLADLISKNLGFRTPGAAKPADKPKEEPKADTKAGDPPTKQADPPSSDKKTIVTKKKAEPVQPNALQIASEAAAAAATAAVTAAMPKTPAAQTKAESPADDLGDDYKRDYEIAQHLAEINPLYKDAPQRILREHARVEEYARGWEARNPGKAYDPEDDEHKEFYESIERPWSADEFTDARADMIAERKIAAKAAKLEERQRAMEEKDAKRELAHTASQTINTVALLLAQHADQTAYDLIIKDKDGFAKLQESDPITAEALTGELDKMAPRIATAIALDDPQRRIAYDKNDPEHDAFVRYLYEKEAQFAGQVDDKGRLFASRSDYVKLPPEQMARRWFLTTDHLISEMVSDGVTQVKTRVEKEKERAKKVAAAMGYIPKPETNGAGGKDGQKTDVTKTGDGRKTETTTTTDTKPVSPSVGSGAKIDNQGEEVKTKYDDMWARIQKNLFPR